MSQDDSQGVVELSALLAGMEPVLDPEAYVFTTTDAKIPAESLAAARGWFREDEGITLIVLASSQPSLSEDHHYARITLTVHSSLSAVGLTAAVARQLTDEGISANVVAAFYHDHVFVPWHQRDAACDALQRLQRQN